VRLFGSREPLWDQTGDLGNEGLPAHCDPKESEDEPDFLSRIAAATVGAPPSHPLYDAKPQQSQRQALLADGGIFTRLVYRSPSHLILPFATGTCGATAGKSIMDRITFCAVPRTLSFDQTCQSSTKARLLVSSEA
jgi:hypothetical protein